MTRRLLVCATLISAIAVAAAVWGAAPGHPIRAAGRQKAAMPAAYYLIECRLLDTGPDGQTRVVSHPTLVTVEGEPAVVRVGREVPLPKAAPVTKGPFEGLLLEVKVCRTEGGQTFLDANFRKSWPPAAPKSDGVRLVTTGVRIIEPVKLGQKISVPLGRVSLERDGTETKSEHFEIVVRDAADKRAASSMGKPLCQPARAAARPGASPTVR